jgi:uncharacterized RDD family membrane protein YckC
MESIAARFWRFVVEACTSTLPSPASPHPETLGVPPYAPQATHETPYAGFWRRLGGLLIDGLVFLPISVTTTWASAQSRTAALVLLIPGLALGYGYHVYFHARWGQTLGKMAARVRVTAVDGSPIGFRQAFLRSAVDILLGGLYVAAYASALLQIPPAEYASLTWFEQSRQLGELEGPWQWLSWVQGVWTISEVVTLLFNRRRRALHDFIASTVVIRTRAVPAVQPSTAV